jgi:hypothetical protein
VIFQHRRKTGRLDLEAIEMAVRWGHASWRSHGR